MAANAPLNLRTPKFEREVVADQLNDGYWVEAPDIDGDTRPDLFGYGLSLGEIYWYKNPGWKRQLVADGFHMPIGAHCADISGNGRPDIVVCYELYGPGGRIDDPDLEGGKIDWIENTGKPDADVRWERHYIGRETGMHRLRVGHFTQTRKPEVMGVPCVGPRHVHGLIPIVLFSPNNDVRQPWEKRVVDDSHFRMIHGAELRQNPLPGCEHLDSILLASEEGVTWLHYDEREGRFTTTHIGVGELSQFEQTGFKGSGDVGAGRIGDDPHAYVAATEPFHGNTLAVYVKEQPGAPVAEATWRRVVLDVFGDPNELGEGPGHQIVCADFDNDGDDEFLVALRGPWPWQGVFYYKAIDLQAGIFTKWRVSSDSTARIAVGDFNGDGRLDFATIAYKVDKYFVAKDAKLSVFHNAIDGIAPTDVG
ncbi:VCBS repeat-containing protein [Streptomyces sp. NPDC052693]|uniref:FG-GAP repeat domain-containing protein n=1 Tax=Streptomyces sp. NPDC052693 TaxID=3155814 RepID=UPI003423001C